MVWAMDISRTYVDRDQIMGRITWISPYYLLPQPLRVWLLSSQQMGKGIMSWRFTFGLTPSGFHTGERPLSSNKGLNAIQGITFGVLVKCCGNSFQHLFPLIPCSYQFRHLFSL